MTASRCIKAVQVKPRGDASAVVHHANSSVWMEDEEGELQRYGMLANMPWEMGRNGS